MNDHLPECSNSMIPDFHNERWICICDQLRACEQRVLNAAREAVDSMVIETVGNSAATVNQAVDTIDALRENND